MDQSRTVAQQLSEAVESGIVPCRVRMHCTCIARIKRNGPKHHDHLQGKRRFGREEGREEWGVKEKCYVKRFVLGEGREGGEGGVKF